MLKRYFLSALVFCLFTVGCVTYVNTVSNRNLSYLYNPSSSSLHPNVMLVHKSDSVSILMVKLYPIEFQFIEMNEYADMSARVRIHYKVYKSVEDNSLIDSSSVAFDIAQRYINNEIDCKIPIRIDSGKTYSIEINTTDVFRKVFSSTLLEANKIGEYSQQNFLILSKTGNPVFAPYFNSKDSVYVKYLRHSVDTLYISYYKNLPETPPPPYSDVKYVGFNFKPDSLWAVPCNDSVLFASNKEGMYFFRTDTTVNEGLSMFFFSESFPNMTKSEQMIMPLQYLMTSKEFVEINHKATKKLGLDNFWLNTIDDVEGAKLLVKIFYNRVVFANTYFTSLCEGWKSDRGMIYTVFGPPETVQKTATTEKWIYGQNRNIKMTIFIFDKVASPFSDNNYVLRRNIMYTDSWYQAVEAWRMGKVYSFVE